MYQLRALRQDRLMTQVELAEKAGLTNLTISRLERGAHQPRFSTTKKLAGAPGVSPRMLAERSER
jgi:transcriptional regulator with XRE-family HTH domain